VSVLSDVNTRYHFQRYISTARRAITPPQLLHSAVVPAYTLRELPVGTLPLPVGVLSICVTRLYTRFTRYKFFFSATMMICACSAYVTSMKTSVCPSVYLSVCNANGLWLHIATINKRA